MNISCADTITDTGIVTSRVNVEEIFDNNAIFGCI